MTLKDFLVYIGMVKMTPKENVIVICCVYIGMHRKFHMFTCL